MTLSEALGTILAGVALLTYWVLVALALGPFVVLVGGVALAVALGAAFVAVLVEVLARPATGTADDRVLTPAPGAAVPAYVSYYRAQVLVDLRAVATRTWSHGRRLLSRPAVAGLARWLMTGSAQPGLPLGKFSGWRLALSVPMGWALSGAVGVGVTLATVVVGAFVASSAVMIGLVVVLSVVAAGALRAADLGILAVRKIRLRCPYPGCYQRFAVPVYRCRTHGHTHRGVAPGKYGVFRRVCACGERLPTVLLGELVAPRRTHLDAFCPHCDRPVPHDLGSARLVHLPLVGGTSAGKTTFLTAMIAGLEAHQANGALTVRMASDHDQRSYDAQISALRAGGFVLATSDHVPTAFLFYVGCSRLRRRLVYAYDPKGEAFAARDRLGEQHYLSHADGLLFVVDVLGAPDFVRRLRTEDEAVLLAARPSGEDPAAVYDRISGELATLLGSRRRRLPVAVVVTKLDVLERLANPPPPPRERGGPAREWLATAGFAWLTRNLDHDFGTVQTWVVSSMKAVRQPPASGQARALAEPALWLLGRTGLRAKALPVTTRRWEPG